MNRYSWQIRLGAVLLCCSAIVYSAKLILIDNLPGTIEYIFNSFGFLFINVLLVTLVINELLSRRSRRERMEKMNMVIGTFFSEVGQGLLSRIVTCDPGRDSLNLAIAGSLWNGENFTAMKTAVAAHPFTCIPTPGDIGEIHHFLHTRRDFLLRLLENPVLLEHQGFTSLLQATFHLAEELGRRGSFEGLPGADQRHLAGDISRVYGQLAGEWVRYIAYLNRNYPYLYSLAVRTNPFDPGASVIITEK